MSKINISNKIIEFLNKNKIRIEASAVAVAMATTLSACYSDIKENSYNSNSTLNTIDENEYRDKKNHIELNIDNMKVSKDDDNKVYHIVETIYAEVPVYDTNENNEKYIVSYEVSPKGVIEEYDISYSEAIYLEIVDLLETKAMSNTKTK